jgi:hypothetical protein
MVLRFPEPISPPPQESFDSTRQPNMTNGSCKESLEIHYKPTGQSESG